MLVVLLMENGAKIGDSVGFGTLRSGQRDPVLVNSVTKLPKLSSTYKKYFRHGNELTSCNHKKIKPGRNF